MEMQPCMARCEWATATIVTIVHWTLLVPPGGVVAQPANRVVAVGGYVMATVCHGRLKFAEEARVSLSIYTQIHILLPCISKHLACLDGIAGDVLHELARPWKRFTVNIQSMVNPVPLAGSPCAHPAKSKSSSVAIDSYEPRAGRCNRPTDSYVCRCIC